MNGNKYTEGKAVKSKKTGLTLVELLVTLGIVALLTGLLIPALNVVRNTARDAKQRAQFSNIELGLSAFKNDYGDYPFSDTFSHDTLVEDYCGAQKLAEALVGRDLLGFHPSSTWSATDTTYYPPSPPGPTEDNLRERKGPYLELATTNAFRLGHISAIQPGLFTNTRLLYGDTFVLCDVFTKKIKMPGGTVFQAGAPILYYKANTSEKTIRGIYRVSDNDAIVELKELADGKGHPLRSNFPPAFNNRDDFFYGNGNPIDGIDGYIQDSKITSIEWPYRPDSYILISAGADGLYGTNDDIRNFGN